MSLCVIFLGAVCASASSMLLSLFHELRTAPQHTKKGEGEGEGEGKGVMRWGRRGVEVEGEKESGKAKSGEK